MFDPDCFDPFVVLIRIYFIYILFIARARDELIFVRSTENIFLYIMLLHV